MFEYDADTFAHDLYEYHLYEKLRANHPTLTPDEIAAGVIEIIGWEEVEK